MEEQLENTIEHISKNIEQLIYLKQENQQSIDNALRFDTASHSEIKDRKRLAAEYDKMIQFSNVEKEYFKVNYLNKYKDKFPYTPQEVLSFLKKFLSEIKMDKNSFKDAGISEKQWKKFTNSL